MLVGATCRCIHERGACRLPQGYAVQREQDGLIDSLANLQRRKLYIYQGTEDSVVYPDVGRKTVEFFEKFVERREMYNAFVSDIYCFRPAFSL